MRAYIAEHKVTGKPWKGKKSIFECTVELRAAMDAAFAGSHDKGQSWRETHEIASYELTGRAVVKETK